MTEDNNKPMTAVEIATDKKPIKVGDPESHLTKQGKKLLAKRTMSVPALIEFLQMPKWRARAKIYDPNSAGPDGKLCELQDIAKVITGAGYAGNCQKVRVWMPYAVRESLKKGAFIVIRQAERGHNHHGEIIEAILCPSNPSPALRELAHAQIAKRVRRGEMSQQQAIAMRQLIGESLAA